MNITEIRVKLLGDHSERLRAFCSMTLDEDFVIRDLKVIEGPDGPFVAMPSRKLAARCPQCGGKNHLKAKYCNDCGSRVGEGAPPRDSGGRVKLHADVAHPINAACRERIQKAVIEAYLLEQENAEQPGYQPQSQEESDDLAPSDYDELVSELTVSAAARRRKAGGGRDKDGRRRRRGDNKAPETTPADSVAEERPLPATPPRETPADSPPDEDSFSAGIL